MFFLEKKERYVLPNTLGNHSFPVYTCRWKIIATSDEEEPLRNLLKDLDNATYRISSNNVNKQNKEATK